MSAYKSNHIHVRKSFAFMGEPPMTAMKLTKIVFSGVFLHIPSQINYVYTRGFYKFGSDRDPTISVRTDAYKVV